MATPVSAETKIEVKPEIDPADNKIEITAAVAKKLVAKVKDPCPAGQTLEATLRNKLRDMYGDDLLECIDVLSLIASTEESFHSILAISRKLDQGVLPTF
jgi:hypothetical protein